MHYSPPPQLTENILFAIMFALMKGNTMKKLLILCAFALASAFCLPAATQYGLFVGVNKFSDQMIKVGWKKLDGCVPDAYRVSRTLQDFAGWKEDNTLILCDEFATVANIRNGLVELAQTTEPGDTVLLFWSSHGDYKYIASNNTEYTELAAHDATYREKDMAEDLALFKSGVKLVVMIDTCHSGGMFQSNWAYLLGSKAAEVSFAKRVDSILSRRKAVGGITSREIGWLTAVSHNQESGDGDLGGRFTTNCLIFDGILHGEADTDGDGNISFLDLYGHARRWFAMSQSESPMMLHEDVLQSVLVRDAAVAPSLPYPFKVTFKTKVDGIDAATVPFDYFESVEPVQFVAHGGSAKAPDLMLETGWAFRGWKTDYSCITNDLTVEGDWGAANGCLDFGELDKALDKSSTSNEVCILASGIQKISGFAMATNANVRGVFGGQFDTLSATFTGTCKPDRKDPAKLVLEVKFTERDGRSYKLSGVPMMSGGKLKAVFTNADEEVSMNITLTARCIRGTYVNSLGQECDVFGNWDYVSTSDPTATAVVEDYRGVYNLALDVKDCDNDVVKPAAGGYLNVSVASKKARINGVLGDGTRISTTAPLMLLTDRKDSVGSDGFLCVPFIVRLRGGKASFSAMLFLRKDDENGLTADLASEKNNWYACWRDSGRTSGGRVLEASQTILGGKGGLYDKKKTVIPTSLTTEVMSFDVPDLYVRGEPVPCVTNALPNGLELAFAKNRFKVVSENPSRFTLSFSPSTGVMSGWFRVFYSDGSVERSATASVYGAWVPETGGCVFGLLSDTDPELKGLGVKRSIPILITGEEEDEGEDEEE